MRKRIVILGAGYAGLTTALYLDKTLTVHEAEIVLINKHHYHYLTTQLHEPAVGTINPLLIKVNIEKLIAKKNIALIKDTVSTIDYKTQIVHLNQHSLTYDYLVVALGSQPETFGIPGVKEHALSFRSLNTVNTIRTHIENMLSLYKQDLDESRLTFVVAGSGFTGIEFIGELLTHIPVLCRHYDVPQDKIKIVNICSSPTILHGFDETLIRYTEERLLQHNIQILTPKRVSSCEPDAVTLNDGERIPTKTIIWAGGVRGNEIVEQSGFHTKKGRMLVDQYLMSTDSERVFGIGDIAFVLNETGEPFPPTGQLAVQQGIFCAKNLFSLLKKKPLIPFRANIKGTIVSIGQKDAIGIVGKYRVQGPFASLLKKASEYRYLHSIGGTSLLFHTLFRHFRANK